MAIPVRTLTTIAGLSLTGASGYYFIHKEQKAKEAAKSTTNLVPAAPKYYDSRPFTLLTSSDIDEKLRSGQFANKLTAPNIKAIYTNQLPSNNPVEDNYSIHTFQNGVIAGVYDGMCVYLIKKSKHVSSIYCLTHYYNTRPHWSSL